MAVKLRLARHGAKKAPYYRIVAANADARRDGRFLDQVGVYDPTTEPVTIRLKPARIRHWLSVGALATDTVKNLLDRHLVTAETNATKGNLDPTRAIWVQGPPNSPAAQGVKGSPAYRPFVTKAQRSQSAAPAPVVAAAAPSAVPPAPESPAPESPAPESPAPESPASVSPAPESPAAESPAAE